MRQPLPTECRDTVTGNAFFHGCVNELTWFLEDKSVWAAVMAMILAAIHVSNSKTVKAVDLTYDFLHPLNFEAEKLF